MSESVELWLFGGTFAAIATLFTWLVSMRLKMDSFTRVAEEIRSDVKECTDAIKAHEVREDAEFKELRGEMQNVNRSLLSLAVKVGENAR